ncbi:hypothetical protein [Spongiimicrobium sp. 3-5]|uniref:hypothetical protein n=1 Tax=Spongiimicrobium sp. 3-5 TaxID=3332596 RepID=UPI00397ECA58
MNKFVILLILSLVYSQTHFSQQTIPMDTTNWDVTANAHLFENYKGKDAVYLQGGLATLKDTKFINGTIEFDMYLDGRRGFPGIRFRRFDDVNSEYFYVRPHQSGNPDANQALSIFNRMASWQLFHGPAYSVPYVYKVDDWTHVKLVVNGKRAQVYFDHAEKPHLSWYLRHSPKEGNLSIGGSGAAVHYADFKIDKQASEMVDFKVAETKPIPGIIKEWEISDKFDESALTNTDGLPALIKARKWINKIQTEENNAADIARVTDRYGSDGNTVFAKLTVRSAKAQEKLFHFGYSDRVVLILNGKPIYKGNNGFSTRDYRYLGTIGLFETVYLNLKQGKNEILLAVSEDFGGWGVTAKFEDPQGIQLQ